MLTWLLAACSDDPQRSDRDPDTTPTSPPLVDTGPTATTPTGSTGDTGPAPSPCDALPDTAPFTVIESIHTQEDFDFDGLGNLVFQDGSNMVGVSSTGDFTVLAPVVGDTAGVQVLSTGDIVYASPFVGALRHIDVETGAETLYAGSLSNPDGLEIGSGDLVYFSERIRPDGRVGTIDVANRVITYLAEGLDTPNGLALSPDEKTLYIAAPDEAGIDSVLAIDQDASGAWGAPRIFLQAAGASSFDGVEVDECGNVYAVGFSDGKLVRVKPDGSDPVVIADLSEAGAINSLYNSLRWGSGHGGWRRDVLYVTDRGRIYAVEAGVRGRPSPITAMY